MRAVNVMVFSILSYTIHLCFPDRFFCLGEEPQSRAKCGSDPPGHTENISYAWILPRGSQPYYQYKMYIVIDLLQGGPFHQILHDVLGAYACYRPDVGYVSSKS